MPQFFTAYYGPLQPGSTERIDLCAPDGENVPLQETIVRIMSSVFDAARRLDRHNLTLLICCRAGYIWLYPGSFATLGRGQRACYGWYSKDFRSGPGTLLYHAFFSTQDPPRQAGHPDLWVGAENLDPLLIGGQRQSLAEVRQKLGPEALQSVHDRAQALLSEKPWQFGVGKVQTLCTDQRVPYARNETALPDPLEPELRGIPYAVLHPALTIQEAIYSDPTAIIALAVFSSLDMPDAHHGAESLCRDINSHGIRILPWHWQEVRMLDHLRAVRKRMLARRIAEQARAEEQEAERVRREKRRAEERLETAQRAWDNQSAWRKLWRRAQGERRPE